jgi:two-component system sensor histidine kinase/response regulator
MSVLIPWEVLALILLATGSLALCWRTARGRASRLAHASGGLRGAIATLTGIGERKRIEEALRQSNDTLRALIEACPLTIMALDPQGRVTLWNRAAERVFGWSEAEVLGHPNPMVPEDKKEEHRFLRERALKGVATTGVEIRRRKKDGSPIDLSVSTAPLRDARGEICGGMSVLEDISERKRSEEALRQTSETLRAVIQATPLATWAIDLDGKVKFWNPAAERIFGWTEQEVLDRFLPAVPEESPEGFGALLERYRRGERFSGVEARRRRKDGSLIDIAFWTSPMHDAGGRINGTLGVVADISDRKRADEKLKQYAGELQGKNEELAVALARAKEATELKSRFLANMSHEIRTPMNGVLGMSELLLGTRLDPEQQGYADAIKSSAEALLTIINDILDISKVEAGRLQTECIPFDLEATVEEALGLLVIGAQAKGLDLNYRISTDVPRCVRGDPVRLRQVLMNVVGNAVKFTDRGSVGIEMELRTETAETATVCFTVKDTGIGIAPEQRAQLFNAFVQGDTSTTRRYGGTGLGLAISAHLVKLMGGEIDFQSELGRGSTFWFTVEFQKAAAGDFAPNQAPVCVRERDHRVAGAHILLAEDNEINRRIAMHILEKAGYRVEAVPNGRTAVEAMAQSSFDLVLMDVQMPEMDGLEATTMIRRLEGASRHVPIIAMTASAMAGDRQRCLGVGMDDYISKPVRREQLLKAIHSWVKPQGA